MRQFHIQDFEPWFYGIHQMDQEFIQRRYRTESQVISESAIESPSRYEENIHEGARTISPDTQHIDNINSSPDSAPAVPKAKFFRGKSPRFWLAFSMLNIIAFISAVDAVILAVVLPNITADLHGSSQEAFWSGTAFLAAATITQPIFGMCSEIFGRRSNLQLALLFFLAGSILCALAPNMQVFVCARLVFPFNW
jgi:hypothetical protein